uniref:Uncharacterized protein n=1 Tax=Paramormyrops kingsleyae TaxID=1676925 RepID=A0A3B3S1T9_9TELE
MKSRHMMPPHLYSRMDVRILHYFIFVLDDFILCVPLSEWLLGLLFRYILSMALIASVK